MKEGGPWVAGLGVRRVWMGAEMPLSLFPSAGLLTLIRSTLKGRSLVA